MNRVQALTVANGNLLAEARKKEEETRRAIEETSNGKASGRSYRLVSKVNDQKRPIEDQPRGTRGVFLHLRLANETRSKSLRRIG